MILSFMSVILSVDSTTELSADIVTIMSGSIPSIVLSMSLSILHEVVDAVSCEVVYLFDAMVWLHFLDKHLTMITSVSTTASSSVSLVLSAILNLLLL